MTSGTNKAHLEIVLRTGKKQWNGELIQFQQVNAKLVISLWNYFCFSESVPEVSVNVNEQAPEVHLEWSYKKRKFPEPLNNVFNLVKYIVDLTKHVVQGKVWYKNSGFDFLECSKFIQKI